MLTSFRRWLKGVFGKEKAATAAELIDTPTHIDAEAVVLKPKDMVEDVVAYDENLLERSRMQWHLGDWRSIAQIDRATLDHHPDRAKLALLVASAHQQLNDQQTAAKFIQLAGEWGCSKKLIAQLLIAGVHNTLGRASALRADEQKALRHFRAAVSSGSSGVDAGVIAQTRAMNELTQLGLVSQATELLKSQASMAQPNAYLSAKDQDRIVASHVEVQAQPLDAKTKAIFADLINGRVTPAPVRPPEPPINAVSQVMEAMQSNQSELTTQIKQQVEELTKLRKDLQASVQKEMKNSVKQLEEFLNLQGYMQTGDLMPAMHGWPVSPDFARYLVEIIEANNYDLIIEFGSGTSTVLMARVLDNMSKQGRPRAVQITFEHLEKYHQKTLAQLKDQQLDALVKLVLAPLASYTEPDSGDTYPYYDCQSALSELTAQGGNDFKRILAVVDGPPAATGKHARYPAVPVILEHFPNTRLDILLDDYIRQDEKEIEAKWIKLLQARSRKYEVSRLDFEKGASLIQVEAVS
jgi:tetratricopeptide (TPR) repeat protein